MGQTHSEQAVQRLRELYRSYGYIQYKMSKFEPYDLYVHNKSFLVSEDILTFTDADGRLMALKPDVTLSIVKNAKEGAGLQKVYYSENVYRTSPMTRGFREIMQTGLECVGEMDLVAMGEVLSLAAENGRTDPDSIRQCYYMIAKKEFRPKPLELRASTPKLRYDPNLTAYDGLTGGVSHA
jgi:ATP phosphoribosyltransferase regulatory subunit